jgi:hypothetical protein
MPLILRRNDLGPEDFTVVSRVEGEERDVGRIFQTWGASGSNEKVWMWTVEWHHRKGRAEPHQGYSHTREEAQEAFKRCWESNELA